MGSVRRTNWRGYLPFLALNVVVSSLCVLGLLTLWESRQPSLPELPTPTFDVDARLAIAVPTATATIPPSPTPVTYTVKAGDTLLAIAVELGIPLENLMAANGLSNPDSLSAGQVLIVPSLEDQAAATLSPVEQVLARPTGTPSPRPEAPQVAIRGAYARGDLENEFVYLENVGGVAAMEGWVLEDGEGDVYTFPAFTLYNGGGVNVYTRSGSDSVINLYWGMDHALWGSGATLTLRDRSGAVQATFQLPDS
jgi:LysM repeat protein